MIHEDLIKITKYNVFGKLPNLFKFNDGTDVKTPEDFERKKEEIKKDAFPIQYGDLPPEPEFLEVEKIHWHWTNTMATYQVTTGTRENPITFFMYYKTARRDPANQPKNPVVIDGDFCWPNARITEDYVRAYLKNNVDLILFDRTVFSHDVRFERKVDGRGLGQIHRTYPDLDIGQIGAWAWGYSRCIDALEKLDICDLSCIAVTGHSRGGKTALLAGILDERITITNPNSSCMGGGGCYRIDTEVTDEFGKENRKSDRISWFVKAGSIDWFNAKLADYMDREDELPFDAHSLKALVAPRILFVSEGASDISANPVGSWQTNMAATEVYKLYGKEENMLWYFRNGDHDHTPGDVEQLCNIIKREKFGTPLNDNFFKVPFKPMELAFDWRCPEKIYNCINFRGVKMENKELKEMYEAIIKSNVLYGKTLVTVGDSITYGEDMDEEGFTEDKTRMTYGWQIANRNNMKFYNLGKSGSTMADVEGKNGFSKENGRYTQMPDQIDYLTIFFGWNDAAYGKLGTIDDTTNETYYGGFNVVLPYLIKKYPDTKICLIVPFGASAGHRQAVREVADKWGVACFDMHKSGTPFHFTKESDVKVDKEIAEFRRAHYQANGAHPNYKGHCLIGGMLEHFLRGI